MHDKRILVVDDEKHILQVLSMKLTNAGFTVASATDGEEALDMALCDPPDLVITDYQMPWMTGVDLCRAMAENDRLCDVPVIMLTARGYSLCEEDVLACNLRGMFSKPFSPKAILAEVQRCLEPGQESGGQKDAA